MERLRYISKYWPAALCAIFYLYLMVHAFTGRQGLLRWVDYERESVRLSQQLEQLTEQREGLETRAARMATSEVDIDWLDHQVRTKMFYSHPKEMTIWLDE